MKFGALLASGFGSKRLERLAAAVQAWRAGGGAKPLQTSEADAGGDALARLAADVEKMTECIARQKQTVARAERRQRELLAKVSHDLRTPLASMQGYLELLLLRQGSLDPAEERNYLQTAIRQSERLARLVRDLFELTRLEDEGMRPAAEGFTLAELAHDVVQSFAHEAEQRSVRLAVAGGHADATALRVDADMGLVERVLNNLVENALRHTPAAGTVTIEVASEAQRVRVVVRDNGEGIASDRLDGLFDRYVDGERVGNAGPQGHGGLGLAIARRIVRLHGGELTVHSICGQGTQIAFDLPQAAPAAEPAWAPTSSENNEP